jgi:hypothetical protein
MLAETKHRWQPRTAVARVLEEAPADVFSPAERVTPLRRPPNFTPAVQRWSFQVPPGQTQFRMAVFGAEAPTEAALNDHPLFGWVEQFLAEHPDGPHFYQNARSRTLHGTSTHLISAYWVNEDRFGRWAQDHRRRRRGGRIRHVCKDRLRPGAKSCGYRAIARRVCSGAISRSASPEAARSRSIPPPIAAITARCAIG